MFGIRKKGYLKMWHIFGDAKLFLSSVVENSNSIKFRQQYLGCNYNKFQLKLQIFFRYVLNF